MYVYTTPYGAYNGIYHDKYKLIVTLFEDAMVKWQNGKMAKIRISK